MQLKNYKDVTYGLSQVKLVFDSDEVQEKLLVGLGMTFQEFVTKFLTKVGLRSLSSANINNVSSVLDRLSNAAKNLLQTTTKTPEIE